MTDGTELSIPDTEQEYSELPRDILRLYPAPRPSWFEKDANEMRTMDMQELLQGCYYAYYPGSGDDGECFQTVTAAGAVSVVIHADYLDDIEEHIAPLLTKPGKKPRGYSLSWSRLLKADDLLWLGKGLHKCFNEKSDPAETKGLLALMERAPERDNSHGIAKILFLHLKADAYGIIRSLYKFSRSLPFLVVIQDHGFGCNYDQCGFGRPGNRLYQECLYPDILPKWLLVEPSRDLWPGYVQCSGPGLPTGMHNSRRALFRRIE